MELKREIEKYYKDMMFYGNQYLKAISSLPLKSDNALLVDDILDSIEYNAKICLQTYRKKRVLTDEEKQHHEFNTPIENTLKYFHTHRNFRSINEDLGNLINRVKEIGKGIGKEMGKNEKDI